MPATIASPATPSHYRPNPRRARKPPGSKPTLKLGVGAVPSIPKKPSSALASSSRSSPFGNAVYLHIILGYPDVDRRTRRSRRRPFCPVMKWQDCTACGVKMQVDIPSSAAYDFYSDRKSFPRWMPLISSGVRASGWCLKYNAFGQDIEYSRLARNMQLTVSYKVPRLLIPVVSALQPLLGGLLRRGLERFATLAKSQGS